MTLHYDAIVQLMCELFVTPEAISTIRNGFHDAGMAQSSKEEKGSLLSCFLLRRLMFGWGDGIMLPRFAFKQHVAVQSELFPPS